jgi:hypothetical protein
VAVAFGDVWKLAVGARGSGDRLASESLAYGR